MSKDSRSTKPEFISRPRHAYDLLANRSRIAHAANQWVLSLDTVLAGVGALAMFFMRPTAFGEVFSLPAVLTLIALTVGIAFAAGQRPIVHRAPAQLWAYVAFSFYVGCVVLSGARPLSAVMLLKGIGLSLGVAAFSFVMLATPERCRAFYDTLARVIGILSIGTLATLALIIVARRPAASLVIGHLAYTYAPPAGTILLPGSMLYNDALTWFGILPRLSGFFREAGIFPAFACWAAGYGIFRGWRIAFSILCLCASVACLSTLGLMLSLITGAGIIAFKMRVPPWAYLAAAPIIVGAIYAGTYDVPYIGLRYKYTSINESYSVRMYETLSVAQSNILFGGEGNGRNTGINLISEVALYGAIGVSLLCVTMLGALQRPRYFLAALLPAFLTALVAQPLAVEPLFIVLFFSWRAVDASSYTALNVNSRRGLTSFSRGVKPSNTALV